MKVSVVLTTYNGEKYIEEQLSSLRCQTRPADEVIISDDCSSDHTAVIVSEYIKKHQLKNWCFSLNEQNIGFIRNFKSAMQKATGDLIFLCDQDDIWHFDKIKRMEAFFDENPDALALATAMNPVDVCGNDLSAPPKGKTTNCGLIGYTIQEDRSVSIALSTVMHSNISAGCTMAIRAELCQRYCQTSECSMPHDHELNLLAAAQKGLYFLNSELTDYRLHGENTLGFREREQSRIEIAEEKSLFAAALDRYHVFKPISGLFSKRAERLKNRRLMRTVLLNFNPVYRYFFTIRERAGDIKFCIKGK